MNLAEVCVFDEVVDGFGTKRLVLYKGFFPQAVGSSFLLDRVFNYQELRIERKGKGKRIINGKDLLI